MNNLTVPQIGSKSAHRIKDQAAQNLQRFYCLSCLTSTLSPLAMRKFLFTGQ